MSFIKELLDCSSDYVTPTQVLAEFMKKGVEVEQAKVYSSLNQEIQQRVNQLKGELMSSEMFLCKPPSPSFKPPTRYSLKDELNKLIDYSVIVEQEVDYYNRVLSECSKIFEARVDEVINSGLQELRSGLRRLSSLINEYKDSINNSQGPLPERSFNSEVKEQGSVLFNFKPIE